MMSQRNFLSQLVTANQRCQSWREKLDFVGRLLADETRPVTVEELVDIAIYLRFLGTGEIPCVEDGRHFRPVHHARIALRIQERLAGLTSPDNAFVVRKIYPLLPSSSQPFQRAEPLTRIRDIAHRNDIPADLKREIKHTLQNKLHRCAGPEDLATSSVILERITAPDANYSAPFVEQFEIFHRELREFFNARSVEERLNALLAGVGADEADLIRSFLAAKGESGLPKRQTAFQALTELRRRFLDRARERSTPDAHEFLLADIGLEDFAFMLLSEMINVFDAEEAGSIWTPLLETLILAVTNLELSEVAPEECRAIEAELRAWQAEFDPADREQLLRLKATADRSRRLAEDSSDRMMSIFSRRAEEVGRAFGVAEQMIRVFSDAEIRSHITFQVSKLVSTLLRHIRGQLALPAWDVLVCGQATGRVQVIPSLAGLDPDLPEPVLVLLQNAEGDEEIPTRVAGIVLAHELPHLSHLGVRARQAGVVLVACEEPAKFAELQAFDGQNRSLAATPETVTWECVTATVRISAPHRPVQIPAVHILEGRSWLPLEQVSPETGGGKADGARRLAELSRQDGAGFKTPRGLVIPFGVMEAALHAAPELEADYRQLLSRINTLAPTEFTVATSRLRQLVQQLPVPEEVSVAVANSFGLNSRLMVRSSANCEDLEEMSGAGLYESVANVAPTGVATAVQQVWASLWSQPAALSRREAGVPHAQAHMAVLIQLMVPPDVSFVLHTVNPITHNSREVYAELALGLGETLASGATRGIPYRLVCDKESGAVSVLAFASFSHALRPDPAGRVVRETLDYSSVELSRDQEARKQVGGRLAAIARFVEAAFKQPQDIEGIGVDKDTYLVQARVQQGLRGRQQ